ncbi:uncharacterized protein LOC124438800 isoform X2 [Xenia sp. Carnegie-2017]|uniref:uncharacterized protein LOC124438800 isoform X2 n=1 Tax=Xenia sp. Carnegie-2017 TaxID=2897299 RepID=UPI001F03BAF8|nr:uncharacterized protein LOC124438800 isoform X2 [Xenia sp. Carnegie-2017]
MSEGIQQLSNCSQQNVEIKLDILSSDEFEDELRTLKGVFTSSYGPTGRTSYIQNVHGGHVRVTSSSSQILNSITTVSSPLIQLLLKSIQGQINQFSDGGIFVALLTIQQMTMG